MQTIRQNKKEEVCKQENDEDWKLGPVVWYLTNNGEIVCYIARRKGKRFSFCYTSILHFPMVGR